MTRNSARKEILGYEGGGLWMERLLAKPSRELLIQNMNERLKEIGMTGSEFARAVGVTPGVVSKWRSGTVSPEVEKLSKIAEVLGIAVADLFFDASDLRHSGVNVEAALRIVNEMWKKSQKPPGGK